MLLVRFSSEILERIVVCLGTHDRVRGELFWHPSVNGGYCPPPTCAPLNFPRFLQSLLVFNRLEGIVKVCNAEFNPRGFMTRGERKMRYGCVIHLLYVHRMRAASALENGPFLFLRDKGADHVKQLELDWWLNWY